MYQEFKLKDLLNMKRTNIGLVARVFFWFLVYSAIGIFWQSCEDN
jgi:hypothetical protein